MRSKLMTTLFATVVGLTAAPFAVDQISNIKNAAARWTQNSLINGMLVPRTGAEEPLGTEPTAALNPSPRVVATQGDFRWSGRVAQGRSVEIKGVSGSIRAEAASGNEVEVTAVKRGRRSNPNEVEVKVVEHEGGVTICAVYPSDDPNQPNVCATDDSGHMTVRNNDVSVDFTVKVPRGVGFRARTVNGEVEANGLGSNVDAKTVNGDIKISTSGIARAKTVNGSITASMRDPNWTTPLEFKTVNGGVTLALPAETSAEVRADTLNGEVSSDFQLNDVGRVSRKHLQGTIGGGGRQISIKTVNGSIRLSRAG